MVEKFQFQDEGCKDCVFEVDLSKLAERERRVAEDWETKLNMPYPFKCFICQLRLRVALNDSRIMKILEGSDSY